MKKNNSHKRLCVIRHALADVDPRIQKEIDALIDSGFQIDILTIKDNERTYVEKQGAKTYYRIPLSQKRGNVLNYLGFYLSGFFLFSVLLTLLFPFRRYKLIQVNTMPDFLVFSTLLPKLFGAKVSIDLHEPTPELWKTKYGDKHAFLYHLQVNIEQKAIQYADIAFTVTGALRQRYIERGADPDKLHVVPNVCNEKLFIPEPVKQFTSVPFIFIIHGFIERRYGHDTLIEAYANFTQKYTNTRLHILGYGDYQIHLRKKIKTLRIEKYIKIFDFMPFNEMLSELKKADAGIVAMEHNAYSELIDTNKMYEYAALKMPVIISRLPVVESNFDASCFEYFEPGDAASLEKAMIHVYNNAKRRQSMVKHTSAVFEKIKWQVAKQHYVKLIKETL